MKHLFEAVAKGEPLTEEGARMFMYGIYLSNGGTPEAYSEFDDDDLDLMFIAYSAEKAHEFNQMMEGLIKIFAAMFGEK